MTKRICMMCKENKLKGFFKHRTDPICIDCNQDISQQRRLLAAKWTRIEREARIATRHGRDGALFTVTAAKARP